MLRTLAQSPKPTIARVHGVALGVGMGLVAACDIALAARDASFGTTEVRLGLTPSTIAPYVLGAIGERAARRYFLSGERFDAQEALTAAREAHASATCAVATPRASATACARSTRRPRSRNRRPPPRTGGSVWSS